MFRSRHTDDYPKFSMTITTMSGDITVSSTSQQLFMLPMLIAGDGLDARVFDPAVPHAIAALLPGGTVNRQRMEAGSLLLSWASDICMSKSVREQQNVLGKDKITALAASYNLTLTGFGHNTGLDRWVAEVADPADPRVTEQVQSNDAKAADDFAAARKRLDLVHHIPWLQHQLDITPDAYVWINYGPGIFQFDPPRFRKMNRPHVAALLEAHASDAMTAWVGEKNGNRKFADFYFLPDGTMILQEFYPGVPPFPFAPAGYEKLPTIGTVPAPFVNSPTWLGSPFVVGLIIHPDGTIETKDP